MTEAIREAAILRLRPIMMTALVAALGLLPAALATGVGTDTQRPFAVVIVGGLILGVAETLTGFYISTGYKDVPGLILLLVVLSVRPVGLFGKAVIKKV